MAAGVHLSVRRPWLHHLRCASRRGLGRAGPGGSVHPGRGGEKRPSHRRPGVRPRPVQRLLPICRRLTGDFGAAPRGARPQMAPGAARGDRWIETELAAYTGVKHAIGVADGTMGLLLPLLESLRQLGLSLGCNDCEDRRQRLGVYCEPCPLNDDEIPIRPPVPRQALGSPAVSSASSRLR